MDTFLAVMSGAFEMIGAVTSWGGALFFSLVAAKYVFTGVKFDGDLYMVSICIGFGLMVFYGLSNIRKGNK